MQLRVRSTCRFVGQACVMKVGMAAQLGGAARSHQESTEIPFVQVAQDLYATLFKTGARGRRYQRVGMQLAATMSDRRVLPRRHHASFSLERPCKVPQCHCAAILITSPPRAPTCVCDTEHEKTRCQRSRPWQRQSRTPARLSARLSQLVAGSVVW